MNVIKAQRAPAHRAGFTLVEILVAVAIIATLAGLIVPAVMSAMRSARIAEVQSDMEKLKTAITAFKVDLGVEPPSEIVLYEAASGWAGDARSRDAIKRVFEKINLTVNRDINGDGDMTDVLTLDGAECLVFFLGGGVDPASGAMIGFSSNPFDPFQVDAGATTTRIGPFYEFGISGYDPGASDWVGRLVDTDGDSLPELLDTLPSQNKPYLYFSSRGGRGYSVDDNQPRIANPYFKGSSGTRPYNEDSFQIISPGFDFEYGTGGNFNPRDTSALSEADRDNITNFHTGTLSDG